MEKNKTSVDVRQKKHPPHIPISICLANPHTAPHHFTTTVPINKSCTICRGHVPQFFSFSLGKCFNGKRAQSRYRVTYSLHQMRLVISYRRWARCRQLHVNSIILLYVPRAEQGAKSTYSSTLWYMSGASSGQQVT